MIGEPPEALVTVLDGHAVTEELPVLLGELDHPDELRLHRQERGAKVGREHRPGDEDAEPVLAEPQADAAVAEVGEQG